MSRFKKNLSDIGRFGDLTRRKKKQFPNCNRCLNEKKNFFAVFAQLRIFVY